MSLICWFKPRDIANVLSFLSKMVNLSLIGFLWANFRTVGISLTLWTLARFTSKPS